MDMNDVPSTSAGVISPQKKRKRLDLGHFTLAEKQCVLNMYKQMQIDEPGMHITAIVWKIVETIGIAKSTAYHLIKEYKQTGKVSNLKQGGGRPALVTNYDGAVMNSVHSFFFENELPTLDKVLHKIKSRQIYHRCLVHRYTSL